jgi:beta-glucosidase-like glycosyl hydrolase
MGELATAWTRGLQSPRPSLLNSSRQLLQVVVTLKHFAVNSLENTAPWNRHTFDANATFGVDPFVLSDYYLKPFERAIKDADARGVMCSYNSVLGTPSCLSPLLAAARKQWGFQGYVTSDTDSVSDSLSHPAL